MGLWNLFMVALMPFLKVLLLTAIGVFLAIRQVDILGADARNHMNNVSNTCIFRLESSTCLQQLGKIHDIKKLGSAVVHATQCSYHIYHWLSAGMVTIQITKAPKDLWGVIIGCCAAGNLGNMPLIIIPSVCKEKGSPFGYANVCNTRGLAYVSLSMAIGSIYIWSYVYNVMRICSTKNPDDAKMDALPEGVEPAGDLPKCSTGPLLSSGHPSVDESHMAYLELEGGVESEEKAKVPFPGNIKRGCLKVIKNPNLRRLFSPSIIRAIIGFAIGSIPLLKKALIGDSAPLRVVEDSVYLLGESAVPIMTLIVGANLLKNKHFKGSKFPSR